MDTKYILWAVRGVKDALYENDPRLARRYLAKIEESVSCARCGEPLTDAMPYEPYFKGYRHLEGLCERKDH